MGELMINKKLKNFLRSKKLLTRYKLNCSNDSNPLTENKFNLDCISKAFIFDDTIEGHDFWIKLAEEFLYGQST